MVRAIVLRRANGAASSGSFQANGASSRGTGLLPVDLTTPRRTGLLPGERGDFQWIWLLPGERGYLRWIWALGGPHCRIARSRAFAVGARLRSNRPHSELPPVSHSLQAPAPCACADQAGGEPHLYYRLCRDMLDKNGMDGRLQRAVYKALAEGRGKGRNVFIVGDSSRTWGRSAHRGWSRPRSLRL
jgi:hypothetical protein